MLKDNFTPQCNAAVAALASFTAQSKSTREHQKGSKADYFNLKPWHQEYCVLSPHSDIFFSPTEQFQRDKKS